MYDILIIGSGLAATSFLSSLKRKYKKVGMISPIELKSKNFKTDNKFLNNLEKNLPPRFLKKDTTSVLEYFNKNKIIPDDNVSIFGDLNYGGVSKYWGGSCEFINEEKVNFLNKKNKKKLINILISLYKNFNFTGKLGLQNKQIESRYLLNIDNLFKKIILNYSSNKVNFFYNCIA